MAAEQPKKPLTAFFRYLEEQRAAIVKQLGDKAKERGIVAKTAAEQWRTLAAADKAPYEEKAATAKVEYDKALENFKAGGGEIKGRQSKSKKDDKPKKDKDAPKKPAGGGYGQFLAENREKIVKSLPAGTNPLTGVAKEAGAQWKALPENEKKVYDDRFAAKMIEFKAAMETYKASKPAEVAEPEMPAKKKSIAAVKRPTPTKEKTAPTAKKARTPSSSKGPERVEIDAGVLVEAQKLGWELPLRNLAGRSDVRNLGKTDKELLAAIKGSEGLVNPARRALLGA